MRLSLGVVLAVCLAGLQFVAVLSVVSLSYVTSERALLEHARNLLSDVGTNAIEHSKGFLQPARGAAELATRLAENEIIARDSHDLLEKLLFQQLQTAPQFAGLFYGDQAGNFIYVMRSDGPGPFRSKIITRDGEDRSTQLIWRDGDYKILEQRSDPSDAYDPRDRPWYRDAGEGQRSVWTDPYIFFSSQRPGITVASPVVAADGALQGVVGVDIEISAISEFLSQLNIGESGAALILNQNGDVIAHPIPELLKTIDDDGSLRFAGINEIDDPIARSAYGALAEDDSISIEQETYSTFHFEGMAYVSTLLPVVSNELPWTIAVYAPEEDFIGAIKQNRRESIWIAAGIALFTGLVGLLLARLIHKPVQAFAVRAALVSQGEIDESVPLPKTYSELEEANDSLVNEIAKRKKSENEYGLTFELASRGMAQIEPGSGRFIRVNARFAETLGYTVEEMLERHIHDVLHPDDARVASSLTSTIRDGSEYTQEMRYVRKDGDTVWLRVNAILIRDKSGKPLHAVATIDDVTERRLSDEKIDELNRDLSHFARVNMMGQMATGLAHEINQPLTAITQNMDSALSIISEHPKSNPELIEILKEVDEQAYRAGDIIRALRSFVRKDDGAKSCFDLPELLEQAHSLVQAEANKHAIEVSISYGDVPQVVGNRVQTAQVVVNLLQNAVEALVLEGAKDGRVLVTAEHLGAVVMVSVEDSGPGVDPDINLFAQFETTKADGMGLGLSICHSIIEANGGELWHDKEGSARSRFCFTIPVQQEAVTTQERAMQPRPEGGNAAQLEAQGMGK